MTMFTTVAIEISTKSRTFGPGDQRVLAAAQSMLQDRVAVHRVERTQRPDRGMFSTQAPPTFNVTLRTGVEDFVTEVIPDLLVSESCRIVWTEDGGEKTELVAVDFAVAQLVL